MHNEQHATLDDTRAAITGDECRAQGRKRYCLRGHDTYAVGRSKNLACMACNRAHTARYEASEKGKAAKALYAEQTRDKRSDYMRRYNDEHKAAQLRAYVAQLKHGERIRHQPQHHAAMRAWLLELGHTPQPGDEVSLIDPWSSSAYIGYGYQGGERNPYVLSSNPDDYCFESRAANRGRGRPTEDKALMDELSRREQVPA